MKLFGRELQGRAKTLVILVAVLIVSAGLCGLQSNAGGVLGNQILILLPLGVAELIAIAVSASWILILLITWGAQVLYERFGAPPKSGLQSLFKGKDDKEPKEPR